MAKVTTIQAADFKTGMCDNMLLICNAALSSQNKALTAFADSDYNGKTIVVQRGTILTIRFTEGVQGVSIINFNALGSSVMFASDSGELSQSISTLSILNGPFINCPPGGVISFVVCGVFTAAAIETFNDVMPNPNSALTDLPTSNIMKVTSIDINNKKVSIGASNYMSGIVTYGTTNTYYTTSGSHTDPITSTALMLTDGYFPVKVCGYNSGSRHYALTRCYLDNRRIYNSTNEEVTGWTADLHFMIHNTYSSAAAQNMIVYILWIRA